MYKKFLTCFAVVAVAAFVSIGLVALADYYRKVYAPTSAQEARFLVRAIKENTKVERLDKQIDECKRTYGTNAILFSPAIREAAQELEQEYQELRRQHVQTYDRVSMFLSSETRARNHLPDHLQ